MDLLGILAAALIVVIFIKLFLFFLQLIFGIILLPFRLLGSFILALIMIFVVSSLLFSGVLASVLSIIILLGPLFLLALIALFIIKIFVH